VHQYREGKVKSTAMSGVKQFLKPDAYKQSELQGSGARYQGSGGTRERGFFLVRDAWLLAPG
jgi:hypothetical protein